MVNDDQLVSHYIRTRDSVTEWRPIAEVDPMWFDGRTAVTRAELKKQVIIWNRIMIENAIFVTYACPEDDSHTPTFPGFNDLETKEI